MKKLLFLSLLVSGLSLQAQTELKISPIALIFGYPAISVEQQLTESFGLDADVFLLDGFFGANLSGKYYFDPVRGIDKFHVGLFMGVQEVPGIGFLAGYKFLSRKNVVFELGLGIGRSFDGGAVGYGKVHLGYRFNKKAGKKE